MKRSRLLIFVNGLLLLLLVTFTGAAARTPMLQTVTPQGTALGNAFTYQGQLKKGGQAFTGTCDFQFSLHGAASAGVQIGEQLLKPGVEVKDGVFAVKLDFGANVFTGQALWLQAAVKCPGDEGFVIFNTRQELTPAPYAIGLVPSTTVQALKSVAHTNEQPGLIGLNDAAGNGVFGWSAQGIAVHGIGDGSDGTGVWGTSQNGTGVTGVSRADNRAAMFGSNEAAGAGVFGLSARGDAIFGLAKLDNKSGVFGSNEAGGNGVFGLSTRGIGVHGIGDGPNGTGVWGTSQNGTGVEGISRADNRSAVFGSNEAAGAGVHGLSARGDGVLGIARVDNRSGVAGINEAGGSGVYGRSARGYAGFFDGKVHVGVLEIAGGADLAEPFDVASVGAASPAPGRVVCIDPTNPGKLIVCSSAYDQTVAGVISGAGGVQPGMVMQQQGSKASGQHPIALTGRVYVWVDATTHPVQPSDLLTTSATPGHAIKVTDFDQARGAVIGKAMTALPAGKGLVLVLVGMQ